MITDFEQKFWQAQEHVAPTREAQAKRSEQTKPNGDGKPASNDDAEILRLAKLSIVQYERERIEAATRLGLRTSILDRLVAAERESYDGKQGRALNLPEPQPWHEPVSGTTLLGDLSMAIRQHVVMSEHSADTAALWAVHTHLLDVFGITPRLAVTSPEKAAARPRCLTCSRISFGARC
jgi:hypothetical protein